MKYICCVYKTGGDYDWRYVLNLYDGLRRNISHNNWRFVCITDAEQGSCPDVLCNGVLWAEELPPYWWSKIIFFSPQLWDALRCSEIITIDLDTIITGNIDWLLEQKGLIALQPIKLAVAQNKTHRHLMSGLMQVPRDKAEMVWNAWRNAENTYAIMYGYKGGGDQDFLTDIWRECEVTYWEELAPCQLASYKWPHTEQGKHHLAEGLPAENAPSIVYFHGTPKPHMLNNWVTDYWRSDSSCAIVGEAITVKLGAI